MAEYIDREALMRKLSRILGACYNEEKESAMSVVLRTEYAVMDSPTADVEPVVHGKWELCFEDWRKEIEGDKCSICGFEHYGTCIRSYNYCPSCGCRMDG